MPQTLVRAALPVRFAPPERRLYRLLDGEDAVEVVRWKDVRSELDAAIDATSQVADVLTAVTLKI